MQIARELVVLAGATVGLLLALARPLHAPVERALGRRRLAQTADVARAHAEARARAVAEDDPPSRGTDVELTLDRARRRGGDADAAERAAHDVEVAVALR